MPFADRFPYLYAQFKIFKHNLNLEPGEVKLRLEKRGGRHFVITAGDHALTLVSASRWRYYKKGVPARLDSLCRQYGYENLIQESRGKVVIDIGGNIGEFSLLASRHGATAYAIEPDPINHAALRDNLKSTSVDASQIALWHEDTTLTFYSSTAGADSSLITPQEQVNGEVKVTALRLDKFTADKGIDQVFLIKADAEGAEPEVLTGAKETLRRTQYIAIDCGPERQGKDTIEEASAILRDCGFETQVLPGSRCIVFGRNMALAARQAA